MYESHFGLRDKPFSLLPDPEYLLLGSKHSMAYSFLEYGLNYSDGFTVITGEIGCGKTTLFRHLLKTAGPLVTFAYISDTIRLQGEILERVLSSFGLDIGTEHDGWTEKFQRFSKFALDEYSKGRRLVLLIDEAQNMDTEALEELRVLSNLNSEKDLLVQIVLTGQPELRQKLSDPKLKQFSQRISKFYHLMPLDQKETRDYIRHRVTVADGDPDIFTEEACDIVYTASGGVPRIINQFCDNALVYGYGLRKERIDKEVIVAVLTDQSQAWMISPESEPPGPEEILLQSRSHNHSSSPVPGSPTGAFSDQEHSETNALIEGLGYVSAAPAYCEKFGLPTTGDLADFEWLGIICKKDRKLVKSIFSQYLRLGSANFSFTTTAIDANKEEIEVNLSFEHSQGGEKQRFKLCVSR